MFFFPSCFRFIWRGRYGWWIHSVTGGFWITCCLPGRREKRGQWCYLLNFFPTPPFQKRHRQTIAISNLQASCVPFMDCSTYHICASLQRSRAQQIVPCTVSQLMSAAQAEDVFRVGEVEVAQVSFISHLYIPVRVI